MAVREVVLAEAVTACGSYPSEVVVKCIFKKARPFTTLIDMWPADLNRRGPLGVTWYQTDSPSCLAGGAEVNYAVGHLASWAVLVL